MQHKLIHDQQTPEKQQPLTKTAKIFNAFKCAIIWGWRIYRLYELITNLPEWLANKLSGGN